MTINKLQVAHLRNRLAGKALSRSVAELAAAERSASDALAAGDTEAPLTVPEIKQAEAIIARTVFILSCYEHDERQPLLVMSLSSSEVKHYTPRVDGDLCVMLAPEAVVAAHVVSFCEAAGLTVILQPRDAYRDAPALSRDGLYDIVVFKP